MPRKILLVDDNHDVRSFLVLTLKRTGEYEILEAATGQEAIEKAISAKPDLILLDMSLPDISGIGVTNALKANPNTVRIPIVALSGLSLVGWKQQALKAGMADFLQKPVPLRVLLETIQKFIPSRQKNLD
jgi:CheY-like chemotaxis protein